MWPFSSYPPSHALESLQATTACEESLRLTYNVPTSPKRLSRLRPMLSALQARSTPLFRCFGHHCSLNLPDRRKGNGSTPSLSNRALLECALESLRLLLTGYGGDSNNYNSNNHNNRSHKNSKDNSNNAQHGNNDTANDVITQSVCTYIYIYTHAQRHICLHICIYK